MADRSVSSLNALSILAALACMLVLVGGAPAQRAWDWAACKNDKGQSSRETVVRT
jgi:hypothetical protein